MYRVLVATFLVAVTVMVTGCTGSLRLGSSVWVDAPQAIIAAASV
jgi:hypothetical protein